MILFHKKNCGACDAIIRKKMVSELLNADRTLTILIGHNLSGYFVSSTHSSTAELNFKMHLAVVILKLLSFILTKKTEKKVCPRSYEKTLRMYFDSG